MLGKLIKHEFRATARTMLPAMGALAALSLLANLSIRGLTSGLSDVPVLRIVFILILVFFGIGIVAAAVMALVIMISRFYRNLLKDEGYLMFTLPVSVHSIVWSKLIVSLVWFLLTALLIFVILALTALNLSNTNLEMIIEQLPSWNDLMQMLDELGIRSQVMTFLFQWILAMVIGTLVTCLHFYASMSLGHMFTKSKILLSVVFFIGMSFLFNLMEMGYGIGVAGTADTARWDIMNGAEAMRFVSSMTWHGIIISAVQGAVLYLATVLGLKKGLNLE
ncbi:MAG: hypothetical protein IJV40_13460 [Oscillospiraceae bacterium]|nr:hypothetical protein [Oscillospiraceae bacterium]